jgi:hypothetical protein
MSCRSDRAEYGHCLYIIRLREFNKGSIGDTYRFAYRSDGFMRSMVVLSIVGVVVLGAASCAKRQEDAPPPQAQAQQTNPLPDSSDWRTRMQANHNADSSIAQQVRRLTADLDLTPAQQEQVRQLSREHNNRIQRILDTAPSTLSYEDFQAQVHAISQDFHNSVNAILTPRQLALMKAMVDRLDNGTEVRHAP